MTLPRFILGSWISNVATRRGNFGDSVPGVETPGYIQSIATRWVRRAKVCRPAVRRIPKSRVAANEHSRGFQPTDKGANSDPSRSNG